MRNLLRIISFVNSIRIFYSIAACLRGYLEFLSIVSPQMFRMNVGSGEPANPDSPGSRGALTYRAGENVALMGPCEPARHGWGLGFNMNTGLEGCFPMTIAERVPQYCGWTVHK